MARLKFDLTLFVDAPDDDNEREWHRECADEILLNHVLDKPCICGSGTKIVGWRWHDEAGTDEDAQAIFALVDPECELCDDLAY